MVPALVPDPETRSAGGTSARRATRSSLTRASRLPAFVGSLAGGSVAGLLAIWVWTVLGCGLIYWTTGMLSGQSLLEGGRPIGSTWNGLLSAFYFSFVTATSIGYGDVVPVGIVRVLAVAEGAAGLLFFGFLVSKLVSRRQEELIEEIHRIAFEDRLGRVRTNLHLVFTEMRSIAASCAEQNWPRERLLERIESAARVFVGELHTVHDLLYRPQQIPDEPVLEAILAGLVSCLREINELLAHVPREANGPPSLEASRRSISTLAGEICGECVPRQHAPALKSRMDQIQAYARQIGAS